LFIGSAIINIGAVLNHTIECVKEDMAGFFHFLA